MIRNTLNGKLYIGSSLNINKRLSNHKSLLRRRVHHSYKLQGSFNKHGEDKFEFSLFEEVYFPSTYTKRLKKEYLESLEQYYIDFYSSYKTGYNVSGFAHRPSHDNTHIASIKTWETRRKIGKGNLSEENKRNISIALRNSEALKKSQKLNAHKRRKKVYQYDLEGNFIKEWDYIQSIVNSNPTFKYNGIRKSISKTNISYKKFIFSHSKEGVEAYKPNKTRLKLYVLKKDNDGNIVEKFDSLSNIGINTGTIHSYIIQNKKYKGFYYSYGEQHR